MAKMIGIRYLVTTFNFKCVLFGYIKAKKNLLQMEI